MHYKDHIKKLVRSFGYDIRKAGSVSINNLEALIRKCHHKDFFFIQIGANDGQRFDPISALVKELNISGIAVEPIQEYYEELSTFYRGTNVTTVNKAIYKTNQNLTMYRPESLSDIPEWKKGIASIDPDHHMKSGVDKSEIIEEVVEAITFETLLSDFAVERVDLLQIDTEGYDKEIIKMIPFDRIKPQLVSFEHGLSDRVMTTDDFLETVRILIELDYKLLMNHYDCVAFL